MRKMDIEDRYKEALSLVEKGEHNKALLIYRELIKESDDPRFYIAYGTCLQELGHLEESINQLEKGIALKPHYCEGDARLFLATSYLKAGQKNKAIEQWKIVEKMEPEYPSYEEVPNEAKRMLEKYA